MASVFPLASYFTKSLALSNTTKTTVYTCGDQGELGFDVTGLAAVASDASEYVLVFNGAVETDYPLQLEGLPIHLVPGDAIKATSNGAFGAHPTHVHISGQKTTRSPKT